MSILTKYKSSVQEYSGTRISQIVACIIYCCIGLAFFFLYNIQIENRKNEILNYYNKIILDNSFLKLEYLLQKFPLDLRDNATINIDKSDIKSCHENKCVKTNLCEFTSIIDKYIPDFIDYKIEINKQLLHNNSRLENYAIEKSYHINKYNQISIGIAIDPTYFASIKFQIAKPLLIVIIFLTLVLIYNIRTIRLLDHNVKAFYLNQYKDIYDTKLNITKADFEQKFNDERNLLMKRIWDLEYVGERDIELNQLFSREANKLAIINSQIDNLNSMRSLNNKILPYSTVLYFQNHPLEKVSIKDLIEKFSARFIKSEEKIAFDIISNEQNVNFASKASLYQIIYSVFNFISFVLKEQSPNLKHNVRLEVMNKTDNLCLFFKYDGNPMQNEEELFKYSAEFFKKHVNPFQLSLDQIFYVLKADNYDCSIGYNNTNFIKIAKKSQVIVLNKVKSNIIELQKRNEFASLSAMEEVD